MKTITYAQAIRETLDEAMARDGRVILLGEDIGVYGGAFGVTAGLLGKFGPDRVIETPISENSFVGVAVGAAMTGLRPVVEIMFMDFLTLAMDQIVNHAAKFHYVYGGQVNVPLVIRTPAGGGRGYGSSHSQSLESWFMSVPGLKVVAPSTPREAANLLRAALQDENPVLFLEHKLLYGRKGEVPDEREVMPIGKALVRKEGADVTVIAYSRMVELALLAAGELESGGLSAEVVDLCSLRPYDMATISASVQKTGKVVIVEEGVKTGGVGAEIAAAIAGECLGYMSGRIIRVGAADSPIPVAQPLEQSIIPAVADIVTACRDAQSM